MESPAGALAAHGHRIPPLVMLARRAQHVVDSYTHSRPATARVDRVSHRTERHCTAVKARVGIAAASDGRSPQEQQPCYRGSGRIRLQFLKRRVRESETHTARGRIAVSHQGR